MEKPPRFRPSSDLKLMDQVLEVLRYYNYAYRTEQVYCQWILRFIRFYGGNTHPAQMHAAEIERFLSRLVSSENVSAATQKQALNALIYLYHKVLDIRVDDRLALRSKRLKRLPTVLTQDEIKALKGDRFIFLLLALALATPFLAAARCLSGPVAPAQRGQRLGSGAAKSVARNERGFLPPLGAHCYTIVISSSVDLLALTPFFPDCDRRLRYRL